MERKMTTADYRRLAQEHEANLEWGRAIDAWQMAIDHYPVHSRLGVMDIKRIQERLESCRSQYFPN